jgi:hypothetical protein
VVALWCHHTSVSVRSAFLGSAKNLAFWNSSSSSNTGGWGLCWSGWPVRDDDHMCFIILCIDPHDQTVRCRRAKHRLCGLGRMMSVKCVAIVRQSFHPLDGLRATAAPAFDFHVVRLCLHDGASRKVSQVIVERGNSSFKIG